MRILGVNLSNNGSICLLDDGKIELYLEAERITKKNLERLTKAPCKFQTAPGGNQDQAAQSSATK